MSFIEITNDNGVVEMVRVNDIESLTLPDLQRPLDCGRVRLAGGRVIELQSAEDAELLRRRLHEWGERRWNGTRGDPPR